DAAAAFADRTEIDLSPLGVWSSSDLNIRAGIGGAHSLDHGQRRLARSVAASLQQIHNTGRGTQIVGMYPHNRIAGAVTRLHLIWHCRRSRRSADRSAPGKSESG